MSTVTLGEGQRIHNVYFGNAQQPSFMRVLSQQRFDYQTPH